MATRRRKWISNVLLVVSMLIAAALWGYGDYMARQVREQENRNQAWREIIDHSPSAVVVADTHGTIVQWSEGAKDLLGWSKNQAEGADLQLIMPPERYTRHRAGFYDEAKRKQLRHGGVIQANGYVLDSTGKTIEVDVRITAVENGQELFVAQITPANEVIEAPPSSAPPPQAQYAPPDIQEFRSK